LMVVSEGQVSGGDKCPDTVVDADEMSEYQPSGYCCPLINSQ